jgi:hypothetical protein
MMPDNAGATFGYRIAMTVKDIIDNVTSRGN